MQRRARAVQLARKRLENLRLGLRACPPANWPQHLHLAWQVLYDDVAASEKDARRLVIDSVSAAHGCARLVDDRSRAGASGSIAKVFKALMRIANCAARGSAKLRHDLDQAMIALLHQTPVDLEVMEAILDAAGLRNTPQRSLQGQRWPRSEFLKMKAPADTH
jgi:hypothetical protein